MEPEQSTSAEATLKRIQKETERVRKRLTYEAAIDEAHEGQEQYQTNPSTSTDYTSIEVAESGAVSTTTRHNTSPDTAASPPSSSRAFVIEASEGVFFEDPVPARNMSSHLKIEHEAFKARYVLFYWRCGIYLYFLLFCLFCFILYYRFYKGEG
jgi:hypothetical protein